MKDENVVMESDQCLDSGQEVITRQHIAYDDAFFVVKPFMLRDLQLDGLNLSVFAIIYRASVSGGGYYTGGAEWICDFIYGSVEDDLIRNIQFVLDNLYQNNFIEIEELDFGDDQIIVGYKISECIEQCYSVGLF